MSAPRMICCLALGLAVCAPPASADPITAVYDVQIVERFSRQGPPGSGVLEPFDLQFALAMTFDPAAPPGSGVYGRPTFSTVPVPIPAPPEALALVPFGSTTHIATETGGFFARAQAGVVGSAQLDGTPTVYASFVQLSGSLGASSPPAIVSFETFPIHLGMFSTPFNFIYDTCLGVGPFGPGADACNDALGQATRIVTYRGIATLRDSDLAPIPEPGTLALAGSGIVLVVRSAKRRRRIQPV